MVRYILAWFPMLLIAILNGAARERGYKKRLGELRAHQLSTFNGALLIGIYIWGVNLIWPFSSSSEAITVGLIWLAMTVIFEFSMVLFIQKKTLKAALAEYNIFAGRVWALFLIWMFLAPYLFYLLRE